MEVKHHYEDFKDCAVLIWETNPKPKKTYPFNFVRKREVQVNVGDIFVRHNKTEWQVQSIESQKRSSNQKNEYYYATAIKIK